MYTKIHVLLAFVLLLWYDVYHLVKRRIRNDFF